MLRIPGDAVGPVSLKVALRWTLGDTVSMFGNGEADRRGWQGKRCKLRLREDREFRKRPGPLSLASDLWLLGVCVFTGSPGQTWGQLWRLHQKWQ